MMTCRHCGGNGKEPPPLRLKFSREGESRGDLAELSKLSGVSQPLISNALAGRKTLSVRSMIAIARALSRMMNEPVTVDRIIQIPEVKKAIQARD